MFGSIALKRTARSGQAYDGTVDLNQASVCSMAFRAGGRAPKREAIVFERYRDSEALVEHAGHLSDLGRAIPGLVSSELLGEPSDDVRAKLVGGGVRVFTPFLSI